MIYKTSSKQGSLQLTEDGYLQVVPLFSKQPLWQEPVSAIKAISVQKGIVMCSIAIHASYDRYVESLSKPDIEKLRAVLPMVQFQDVQVLPSQSQVQPGAGQVQFAPQMETTVKTYKKPQDYQHDLKKMQRQGWSVQNSLDHHRDRSMAYKLFVPFGAFSGGTGQIVVTYERPKR